MVLRAMNSADLNNVWDIKALNKPGQEEAMKISRENRQQVQPIMRKHNWRVKLLSEVCPNYPALLGLNVDGGIQVKLRLRRSNRDWDFYPFDQALDTLLHELCQNAHGSHNASFYKLWNELRMCEELMGKGISGTGEGFDLPGRHLGGLFCQPPLSSLQATELAAAEKRSRVGSLLLSGPKLLAGNNSIMSARSPIQAAERILRDEIWFGSASCEEASEAGEDSSNPHASDDDTITRKRSSESDKASPVRPPNIHHLGSNFVDLTGDLSSGSVSNHGAKLSVDESSTWECGVCTLFNPPLALICEVCARQRPKDLSSKSSSGPVNSVH